MTDTPTTKRTFALTKSEGLSFADWTKKANAYLKRHNQTLDIDLTAHYEADLSPTLAIRKVTAAAPAVQASASV